MSSAPIDLVSIDRATLEAIRTSMVILQRSAEGCALNHYGIDSHQHGMPGWLIDTNADLQRFTELLASPLTQLEQAA